MQIFETIAEVKKEELRDNWQRSAFTAYLVAAQFGAAKEDSTFNDFLQAVGLSDDTEIEVVENTKEEAMAIADRVLAQFNV